MHKTDAPGNVAGEYVEGNPFIGLAATVVSAKHENTIQRELVNVVVAGGGLVLDDSDDDQVRRAIQIMIDAQAGGLTENDRGTIDATAAYGDVLERTRTQAVRWIQPPERPGCRLTAPTGSTPTSFTKIVEAAALPLELSQGGTVRVFATGTYDLTQRSSNPSLAFKLFLGGTLIRPAGAFGSQGWLMSNGTTGRDTIGRVPTDARWILDVTLISLGQFAEAHNGKTDSGNPGQIISRGFIELWDMVDGAGLLPGAVAESNGGLWISGNTYTPGDLVWLHGESYRCYAEHVASSSDQPGAGVDWYQWWVPAILRFEIAGVHEVDLSSAVDELRIELELGGILYKDYETMSEGTWSSGHGTYSVDDGVDNTQGDGERYVCSVSHTAAAGNEPGVSAGWQHYWALVGDTTSGAGVDTAHVDLVRVTVEGGAVGLGEAGY